MNRRYFAAMLLSVALICCGVLQAGTIASDIERALNANAVPGSEAGVCVMRVSDGRTFFSREADRLFEIASNAKLFTTAAALHHLGPEYEFRTSVITNGPIEDGMLRGDLVIVGGGDPCISGRLHGGDVMHVPEAIADAVSEFGIRTVAGDLVMDDRFFDRKMRPDNWPAEESLWWYAAPVSALSFNDNCIDLVVRARGPVGAKPDITVSPDLDYVTIRNEAEICSPRLHNTLAFSKPEERVILLSGRMKKGAVRGENITVESPPLYLAAAIRSALETEGIHVEGGSRLVERGERARPEALTIFEWRTPLVQAVKVANQRSQNFFAEQILKTMGAEEADLGSTESGLKAIRRFTREIGLRDGTAKLADGCGLAPGSEATPRSIVRLLHAMWHGPVGDVFPDSLAESGDSAGTLRHRFNDPVAKGRIHAKTGTIKSRGISALSGYVETKSGETYAFSILVNGFKASDMHRAKSLENAICRAILGN